MQKLIESHFAPQADEHGYVFLVPEETLRLMEAEKAMPGKEDFDENDWAESLHFGGDLDSGVGWLLHIFPFGYGILGIDGAEKVKNWMWDNIRRCDDGKDSVQDTGPSNSG